jgi:hypothetical protein
METLGIDARIVSSTGAFNFAPATKTTKDRAASSSMGASSGLSQASSNMSNGGSGGFTGFNLGREWTTQPVATMANVQTKSEDRREKERQALASLAALGINVQLEDLGKLNKSDIYGTELEVMAEVRGYFQIAYKVRLLLLLSNLGKSFIILHPARHRFNTSVY